MAITFDNIQGVFFYTATSMDCSKIFISCSIYSSKLSLHFEMKPLQRFTSKNSCPFVFFMPHGLELFIEKSTFSVFREFP